MSGRGSALIPRVKAFARTLILSFVAMFAIACGGVRERIAHERPTSTFDPAELIDVLPPDRIGAIDRPRFESPERAADWLRTDAPVVVVQAGDEARAYPLAIMVWHEVVNDTIDGRVIAVVYGPLYNTATAFVRVVAGESDTFGVSGKLYRSDLVIYDRRTRSLWRQSLGRAVAGPRKGITLTRLPSQVTSFAAFRTAFPAGLVLSRETGANRAYGFNPYERYDTRAGPFEGFFARRIDKRLPAMQRIIGIGTGESAIAFSYRMLAGRRVLATRVEDREVVLFWQAGTRSALDSPAIAAGREVGSAAAFSPMLDGRLLEFEPSPEGIRDRQTGSIWTVLGVAISGPLGGRRLDWVEHLDSLWFAWSSLEPQTGIAG